MSEHFDWYARLAVSFIKGCGEHALAGQPEATTMTLGKTLAGVALWVVLCGSPVSAANPLGPTQAGGLVGQRPPVCLLRRTRGPCPGSLEP